MDYAKFINPPPEYGEVSFFWWQGDPVTREKLTWILDQLEAHHICDCKSTMPMATAAAAHMALQCPVSPIRCPTNGGNW